MRLRLLALVAALSIPFATAEARPRHHVAKSPKTHRILANSKSVRINNIGEVITTMKP